MRVSYAGTAPTERAMRAPDVQHVAVMPDVHLAGDVCIGVAIGTTHLIYPQAVGGDHDGSQPC
jgi:tRNA-splicing ligase RtcB